jgi:hypothetical protein
MLRHTGPSPDDGCHSCGAAIEEEEGARARGNTLGVRQNSNILDGSRRFGALFASCALVRGVEELLPRGRAGAKVGDVSLICSGR